MKTIQPKKEELGSKWFLIDGKDQVLGRLASKISIMLQGKDTPYYAPYLPGSAWILVINSQSIKITGSKYKDKKYWTHSRYPGGIKSVTYEEALKKNPEYPLKHAVKGMLPQNTLGKQLLNRLKVYPTAEHPHAAQKPETIQL